MKTLAAILVALVGAFGAPSHSYASPYSDALAQCLVKSTSQRDRAQLVRWMFLVLARHPALKSIAANDAKALDGADRAIAGLITRLVTESCRSETRKVIEFEGTESMKRSFGALGRVAVRDLFADPQVRQAMSGFARYLDKKKLEAVSSQP